MSNVRDQATGSDLWSNDESVVEFGNGIVQYKQPKQGVVAGPEFVSLQTWVPWRRAAAPVGNVRSEALVRNVILVPEHLYTRGLEER